MSGQYQQSPSPSDVGFELVSRRTLLASAAAVGGAAFLAACGSSSSGTAATTTAAAGGSSSTAADTATTVAAASGNPVSVGVNEAEGSGNVFEGLKAGLDSTGIAYKANYVKHVDFQNNITQYLQQPEDVFTWFAGYRMRFFAAKGLTGDLTDVWANLPDFTQGFKSASTGDDGKQYFVPRNYYPWAVHYRKSVFAEKGYTIPKTKDDLLALCKKMQADGLVPFAYANDEKWQCQGTFDILNMRLNGYQFHVDLLAGKESWTGDKVKNVFKTWTDLLPFHQQNPNGRKWQEAATDLEQKKCGMYYLGTFVASNSKDQTYLDDLDFFNFPELDSAIGADAVDAPIDGWMMAAKPKDEAGAKKLLTALGGVDFITALNAKDSSAVPANSKFDTSKFTPLQKKSADLVGSAKHIAQFLDRDTSPDFVSNVIADAFASFHNDPTQIDTILKDIETQKSQYLK